MVPQASQTHGQIAIIGLLVLIGVGGLLVWLFISPARRRPLGIVLGVILLVVLGLAAMPFSVRRAATVTVLERIDAPVYRGTERHSWSSDDGDGDAVRYPRDGREMVELEESPAEPWKSAADLGFDADVHPSIPAAYEALTVQVLQELDRKWKWPEVKAKWFRVAGGDKDIASVIAARVQRMNPDWQWMNAPTASAPSRDDTDQMVTFELEPREITKHMPCPWTGSGSWQSGTVAISLFVPSSKQAMISRSAKYAEKPWIENTSLFLSSQTSKRWIVGRSSQNATDQAEARQQAIRAAANQIMPILRADIQQLPGNRPFDSRYLRSQIERELANHQGVKDRFDQTFICPSGGQVFREAILVDAGVVADIAKSGFVSHRGQVRESWAKAAGSAIALVLLVSVLGLVVNAATKGYYRGRVVLTSGLVILLGLVFTALIVMA